jgi:NAD(P)-dependent dehydrogenase (short-subunit alcohol dehydrogenase family)
VDLQLDGKAARVTGASKGIGRHVAEHLAAKGTEVAITVWAPGPLELTAREIQSATGRGAHLPVDGALRKVSMGW